MDSAVYSENPANVEFAIDNSLMPRYTGQSYGGSTFSYVCQYAWQKTYREMAYQLVEQANNLNKLQELLTGSYRKGSESTYCIEALSKAGLADLVALCAGVGAGKPIIGCEIKNHTHHFTEPAHHNENGQWQQTRNYSRTITFPVFYSVGNEIASYLKDAIFQNLRGDGSCWKSGVFDSVAKLLGITPPEDDDKNLIPFCLDLRRIALAEAEKDPGFLHKEFSITDSFRERALEVAANYR